MFYVSTEFKLKNKKTLPLVFKVFTAENLNKETGLIK